jgi:xylono-1,5-lactonase
MERLATGFGLIEGPTWEPATESLVFSDAAGGGVWRLRDDRAVEAVIERRRGVGGIVPHADGGIVVTGRDVSWVRDGTTVVLLRLDPALGLGRFNDLGTDKQGGIWVGALDYDPSDPKREPLPGALYAIDAHGRVELADREIGLANGLDTSPDGATLYFSDTSHDCVWRYRLAADGTIAERDQLIEWPGEGPDGLAVAEDGSVFVALSGSARVAVVDPAGVERASIAVDALGVTNVCFGGPELRTLYITTFGDYLSGERTGAVYATASDVAGDPVTPAAPTTPAPEHA